MTTSLSVRPFDKVSLDASFSVIDISNGADFKFLKTSNLILDAPLFEDLSAPFYTLVDNSPLRAGGIDVGLSFKTDQGRPDVGINRQLTNLDSLIYTQTDCNGEYGGVEVVICNQYDLLYSVDGHNFSEDLAIDGLEGGDYLLTIKDKCDFIYHEIPFSLIDPNNNFPIIQERASCGESNGASV